MATQTFEPSDFDKLFTAKAEANPQHAEVGENLSGQAQLLKSADSSLVQKNLQGNTVEENILVEKAQHQTMQTNQTDAYERGVSTNLTEVAPSIHTQYTLTEGIVQTTTQKNLNVTTQDERETYHQANVERYHKTLQSNMPTELDQTIQQSGQSTVNQQQSDIKRHTVNSTRYTQKFKIFNYTGPLKISQNTNLGSAKFNIGGAPDMSGIDFTLQQIAGLYFPKISAKIYAKDLKIPPIMTKNFVIKGLLTLSAEVEALNHDAVNPATFDDHGFGVDFKRVMNRYFGEVHFKSILHADEPSKETPEITIGYAKGEFEFSQSFSSQRAGKGYIEITYTTQNSVPVHHRDYLGWDLKVSSKATLVARFYPKAKTSRWERELKKYANEVLSEFWQVVKQFVLKPTLKYDPAVPSVEQVIETGLPVEVELFDLTFIPAEDGVLFL